MPASARQLGLSRACCSWWDWTGQVPDFSTLCRRQRAPERELCRIADPRVRLNLLSTNAPVIKAERRKANGMPVSMVAPTAHLAQDTHWDRMRKLWKFGRSRSPAATSETLPMPCPKLFEPNFRPIQGHRQRHADGAYDTRKCTQAIARQKRHAVIPPRRMPSPEPTRRRS